MKIYPFAAIRSPAHRVSESSCPPYDVVDRAQAAALAAAKPNSFMRVVRSEVDFAVDFDSHSPEVYQRARENFFDLIARGYLEVDPVAGMYVYRQSSGGRRQAGLVCCVDVADYRAGTIRRHELTRPEKEHDRVEHMRAVGAHCEPVLLTVTDQPELAEQLARDMNHRPIVHFRAPDGVTHTLWNVQDIDSYHAIFGAVDLLYIADGHHRCAAAARVAELPPQAETTRDSREAQHFPAAIFPAEELHILPYHRLARLAPGQQLESLERALAQACTLEPISESVGTAPVARGELGVFLNRAWWRLRLPAVSSDSPLDHLDVVRLSKSVLAPILGIVDERSDPRISFLGGCSIEELAACVLRGEADVAFAIYPTSIDELLTIARASLIMPPKSTWFDPKLRSGLFAHSFESRTQDPSAKEPLLKG